MKTIYFTLLILIFTTILNAQETTSIKKWSFGAELFPNYTYEVITNDGTVNSDIETFYRDSEISKFCLSGQVYATYKINMLMNLSLGLGYQNTGNKTKETMSVWITPDGTFDSSLPTKFYFKYNHHSIQVPLFYTYNITPMFYARSGVSSLFNFSNTVTSILTDSSGNVTKSTQAESNVDFRTINFSGNLGLGYTFFRSSTLNLYIQTNVEIAIMQLSKTDPLNRRPVSVGLIFGARL